MTYLSVDFSSYFAAITTRFLFLDALSPLPTNDNLSMALIDFKI